MKAMNKTMAVWAAAALAVGAARAGDAGQIVVDGSTTVGPIAKAFAENYMAKHPEANVSVSESGSGNGAKSLINAACDVATMSRPMKGSERKAAQDAGVLPIEHVVAMDGIALVVNNRNPVANLTIEQIRDVYAGKIRRWSELGGPDEPIVAISRDTNSGTYECFETLVLAGQKMDAKVEYVGSNGAVRQRVMSTPGAIGYVGLAFTEGVKAVPVEGVEATPETVVGKEYPIARPLYMYTNGRPAANSPLADFVGMANTAEGKQIIADTGFVPLP